MPDAKSNKVPGKQTLWTYRILGTVVALLIMVFPYLIPPGTNVDPLWQRTAIAGIILLVTIGNFVSPFFQRYTYYFVYGYSFLINAWLIELAYLNNFSLDYAPTVFVTLISTSLVYKHFKLLVLNLVTLFVLSACLYGVPPAPLVNPFFFMMLEASVMIGTGILMDRQINERTFLRQRAARERVIAISAFEHSEDGILVTDSRGKVLQYNDRFRQIWDLTESDLKSKKAWFWLEKVTRSIQNSEGLQAEIVRATEGSNDQLAAPLYLKNNRIVEQSSRPLHYQGGLLGRIWVYKDITEAETEKSRLAKKRLLLEAKNKALSELAANTGMYGGDLGKMLFDIGSRSLEVLRARRVCIWLANAHDQAMHCELRLGYAPGMSLSQQPFALRDQPAFAKALSTARVLPVSDARNAPELSGMDEILPELKNSASLCVPLRYAGEVTGFIALQDHHPQRNWTRGAINFASSLGDIAGIVLEARGRKDAESKLQEKLEILKSVFEVSGVGMKISSQSQKLIDHNATFAEMWGLTADQLQPGQEDRVHQQIAKQILNQEEMHTAFVSLTQNPAASRFDVYYLKDGRIVERTSSALRIDGKIVGRTWFYHDVTQRKRDEEALKASEIENRAIVNAIPDLLLSMGADGKILRIKHAETGGFEGLKGQQPRHILELFPGDHGEEIYSLAQTVANSGQSETLELQLEFAGKMCDLEIRLNKSQQEEILALIRDVSLRKEAERELLQRNFELDSFVYRSSHDLKAPLNSLMGLISLLQEEDLPVTVEKYIGLMDRSVVKLDTFIRNLTEFSRIARMDITPESIDFHELFEEIEEGLQYMEHAGRVTRHLHFDGDAPLYGDRFHLSVVLSNLISNSIKYQDHNKPNPRVDVRVKIRPEQANIEVADNGIGIPQEYQSKLFELFFRASTQSFGSGLGLYITKNAIEKIDGQIEIDSKPGMGTSFRITLPNRMLPQEGAGIS